MPDFRTDLEQLYRQRRQGLFSLALTVTGCCGLAEDAVHEAFAKLCERGNRPEGSLAAYVFAAVRNAAIDLRRRQQHQHSLAMSVFAESAGRPTSSAASDDSSDAPERLRLLIDRLDDSARELLVMKIFGELTFDELSQVLQQPAATIATRYRRTVMQLQEQMKAQS